MNCYPRVWDDVAPSSQRERATGEKARERGRAPCAHPAAMPQRGAGAPRAWEQGLSGAGAAGRLCLQLAEEPRAANGPWAPRQQFPCCILTSRGRNSATSPSRVPWRF